MVSKKPKNGHIVANFNPRMPIFNSGHEIDHEIVPANFYCDILRHSIFRIFWTPKMAHISATIIDKD